MRYLIDTNIFVYLSTDVECLSKDVAAIIQEPETCENIAIEKRTYANVCAYGDQWGAGTQRSLRPRNYCACHNGTSTAYIKWYPFRIL